MSPGRHPVLAAAAALLLPAIAAAAPSLGISVLQCDGSYATNGNTHTPNPNIHVAMSDPAGLRIGSYPLGDLSTTVFDLWHFDQLNIAASCPGNLKTQNFAYTSVDALAQDVLTFGTCVYTWTINGCTGTPTLNAGASLVPAGLASCPASPPAVGTFSNVLPASSKANFGTVLTFNGSSQYASAPYDAGTFNLNPNYALSAWVNSSGSGTQRIASVQSGPQYWVFRLVNGQLQELDSRDSSGGTYGPNISGTGWHLVTFVRINGSTTGRRYYVDGVLVGAEAATSTDTFRNHPIVAPLYVSSLNGGSEFFNGQLDDLRIADSSPNDDTVMLEYQGTMHKYSTNGGVGYSTAATGSYVGGTPADGVTSTVFVPPEPITTGNMATSRWIFAAQNLGSASTVLNSFPFSVTIDNGAPIAPTPSATGTSPYDLQWTWGTPPKFCPPPGSASVYFQLADAVTNAVITPPSTVLYPTSTIGENVGGAPNQLRGRKLMVTDAWGPSLLSASASYYSLAQLPATLSFASVSTGGVVVSWGANGNPGYTRYELTYSPDNFAQTVSTRVGVTDNWTATSVGLAGLAAGTTYYARLRAFNGQAADLYGGVPTTYYVSAFVVATPPAPTLSAVPLGVSSITWSWTQVPGASGYTLYDSPTQTPIPPASNAGLLQTTTTNLWVNARYDAEVEAEGTTPSARTRAFTYTNANPPASPSASAVFSTSATFTWGPNGNPPYTIYQVVVATDPTYGVVVATLSVAGTTVAATNLLPGATYYARVLAVSGAQVQTAFVSAPQTATAADPRISQSPAPPTPYVFAPGLVGSWAFDEGTGATTADLSGNANPVSFWCLAAGCASTPTFAAGPPGLGTAASFPGVASSVALSNSGAPFAFADSLTVEAWVDPQTAAQLNGAGVVARGNQGAEDFALDVFNGAFRFVATPSKTATVSTATIAPGQWTHVAGVYDSAAGNATLYLNGSPAAVAIGVPARSNSGQPLAIGNRENASGTGYNLGFLGLVDSVRVFHRALSAAEISAEYQGSFVSTVAAPAPNSGILVALPPNAFGAPAQIFFSADPVNHPIRIGPTQLAAGLASPPGGLTLVANSVVEIVPIVGGLPFATPLGSSATVSLPYADANGDNVIDGSSPPLAASLMTMYTLNTTVNRWEALPTTIDPVARRATAVTPHFSVFALFAPVTIASSLSSVRVYPVPWKPGSGGRFDGPGVAFDNLPASGSIRVLTSSGARAREFSFSGAAAGKAVWDGLNDDGRRAASGVYFARIKSDADGSTVVVKFAIER